MKEFKIDDALGGEFKVQWPAIGEAPMDMIGLYQHSRKGRSTRCILLSQDDTRKLHGILGQLIEKF